MAQLNGASSTSGGLLNGLLGTAAAAADFALGAGWGSSTKAVTTGSNAQRGELVITAVTGGGLAQATATVVFTFPDGAYNAAPFILQDSDNDNSLDTGRFTLTAKTTTTATWTFSLLPVNGKIYKLRYIVVR